MAFTLLQVQQIIANAKLAINERWLDRTVGKPLQHNHAKWSGMLLRYALTLPQSQTKNNLLEIGVFVSQHPEMCYPDYADHFKPDDDTVKGMLTAFKDRPGVIKYLEITFRNSHPNIPVEMWKW